MPEQKVAVVGCGLVGGSICLALRRRRPDWKIVALDLADRVPAIVSAGVADVVAPVEELVGHLNDSAVVILAAPVHVLLEQLNTIGPHLREGTIVSDVGSTKQEIVKRARSCLPQGIHFIGGHPIAGSEKAGAENADPLIFKGRPYVLCPESGTPVDAILTMIDIVDDLGAVPITLEAEEHDDVLAVVSHVPHLLAIALVDAATAADATHGLMKLIVGRGFLDSTRIAAADYDVWESILETNRQSVNEALDRFEESIRRVRRSFDAGHLRALWNEVSLSRRRLAWGSAEGSRKHDLRARIDAADERLLKALGERLRCVERMGQLKRESTDSVYDPVRERLMMLERQKLACSLDLPTVLVEELFERILSHSRRIQVRPASVPSST